MAPGTASRLSLRRLAFWMPIVIALLIAGAALSIGSVTLSVIRLADSASEDAAPRQMEELRAIGNLERLIALGDQFALEHDTQRSRTLALGMQALALHPSIASLTARHSDVASTFSLVGQLQQLHEQQAGRDSNEAGQEALQARWAVQRALLKDIADQTAVDLIASTTTASRNISRSARHILFTTVSGALLGLAICLLLLFLVRRFFIGPLLEVSRYLNSRNDGQAPAVTLPRPNTLEMADVMRAALELADAQAALKTMALSDQLTGLANRFALEARLDQSLAHARRNGTRLALLFIDLDRFKSINDTLGHTQGDEFLKVMARRLGSAVRDGDTVARLGGDEFIIVINDVDDVGDAADAARKLVELLARPVALAGLELNSTASVGVSLFPDDGADHDTLMKSADLAMYHAKSVGRNNFQFFTAAMNEAISAKLELESALRVALENGEFVLHYQPQVCGQTGRLTGFEALIRWQRAAGELVGPLAFIGVAEETGLIGDIGAWVLETACATLQQWRELGWTEIRMAINLSALQLKDTNLPALVQQQLQIHALPPDLIELEVTESVAMQDPQESIHNLLALKALGVSLAIDDFGTGYSSLAYLRLLPIDRLKMDRAFVSDIGVNATGDVICGATIALAHALHLELVAEGVETERQRDYLQGQGCDTLQGYLYGKPMAQQQALAWMAEYARRG